jgi:hypothetical protein
MVLVSLMENSKGAVADGESKGGEVRFLLADALAEGVLVLLLMFFEIAHVEVLFIAALDFTNIPLPFFLVLEVHLHVLFEVGGRGE